MVLKNEEGYPDPTYGSAYRRIRNEEKKRNEADAVKMDKALHRAQAIFQEAGFEVAERIVLKNIRTGSIYR